MTKLEFVNKFLLQWFFIRLAKISYVANNEIVGWRLLYFIIPLTGWSCKYKYIGKIKYLTLWEKK